MGISHSKHNRKRYRRQQSSYSSVESTPNLSRSSSTINSISLSVLTTIEDDEQQQEWLTNTHFVLKHCFGDNFSAPVHNLLSIHTRVLDVACGFGVWVLEMASTFPTAAFYGIDIAPIYPNTVKPPNATFQQCDILQPLPYPNEFFDYIHMRLVCHCFSAPDLKFILKEMNRVLKPGGYIEIRDIDPVIKNSGPTTEAIFSNFASQMFDVTWTQRLGEILKNELELTDIHCQNVSVGFNDDGGGMMNSVTCSFIDTIKSYKDYLIKTYDMTASEYQDTLDCITQECSKYQSYFQYYMSWGRKPLVPRNWIAPSCLSIKEPHSVDGSEPEQQDDLLTHDILHLTLGFTE